MRALAIATVLLCSSCYRSHARPELRHAADAGTTRDAGTASDAGTAACDPSKLRTSGLVEPWARGSFCDQLVACLDTSDAIDAARASFPDLTCRDAIDAVCVGAGASSCTANVGTLSDADYDAACRLTLRGDVGALVCSGDL